MFRQQIMCLTNVEHVLRQNVPVVYGCHGTHSIIFQMECFVTLTKWPIQCLNTASQTTIVSNILVSHVHRDLKHKSQTLTIWRKSCLSNTLYILHTEYLNRTKSHEHRFSQRHRLSQHAYCLKHTDCINTPTVSNTPNVSN